MCVCVCHFRTLDDWLFLHYYCCCCYCDVDMVLLLSSLLSSNWSMVLAAKHIMPNGCLKAKIIPHIYKIYTSAYIRYHCFCYLLFSSVLLVFFQKFSGSGLNRIETKRNKPNQLANRKNHSKILLSL